MGKKGPIYQIQSCNMSTCIKKLIRLNENAWVLIQILLKFVPNGPIMNKRSGLVQVMALCQAA